jgi:hypothetical protein
MSTGLKSTILFVIGLGLGSAVVYRFVAPLFHPPRRIKVDNKGNVPPLEKYVEISVSGVTQPRAIFWESEPGTHLDIPTVTAFPLPWYPYLGNPAPLLVKCNPDGHHENLCITLPLTPAQIAGIHAYQLCVTVPNQQPACSSDPWIHINP